MEEKLTENRLCKIIYFDEESVTDYLQLMSGGTLQQTTELLDSTSSKGEGHTEVDAKVGISGVLKALLGWGAEASAGASIETSFNRDKMVRNIIKNTILTDFVNVLDGIDDKKPIKKMPKGTINKFHGYKISVEKDSLSYFVMISPYMNMFQSGAIIPSGDFNISVDKLDNVLRNAKGYYEFIGTKGRSKVVLRFNINSFKNNYMISDLMKMNLSIYAVKVGETTLDMLDINNELNLDLKISVDNPSYESNETQNSESSKSKSEKLQVFDVLLAGVESDA